MTFESIDTYDISITEAIKSHYKDIIHQIDKTKIVRVYLIPQNAQPAIKLTQGYDKDPSNSSWAMFAESYNEMVLVKDIELYSLCEHHMLPFSKRHISHIRMAHCWFGKIPRVVDVFSRRLGAERSTEQILCINTTLEPKGVVVIEFSHA